MATLTAPSGATARATRPQTKVAAGSISILRVRPFTRATRSVLGAPRQQVLARAAEPEAAVDDDFSFSLSDAKKGNEYNASDVEAALRFYEEGGVAPGEVNSEFVVNEFGIEDASFFDDIDNNESYMDEFIAAGIPEAAPKQRQGRQRDEKDDAPEDNGDIIAAAKEVARVQQIEEDIILESQLEEFGQERKQGEEYVEPVGPSVWDWMSDVQGDDDEEELNAVARGTKIVQADVLAALPTDEEIFAGLRGANLQEVDETTRDAIEFMMDDYDLDNEVKAVDPERYDEAFEVPQFTPMADSDLERIDDLLKEDLSLPELDLAGLDIIEDIEDDGLEMPEDAVQKYVAGLKDVKAVEATEDQIKAIFADEPIQLVESEGEPITMDDVDLTEPEIPEVAESDLTIAAIEDDIAEEPATGEFEAELRALRSMPEPTLDIPPMEELDMLDSYLEATESWVDSEVQRKAQLAQQVAAGALPADVLEEEEYVDVEGELLMPDDFEDMEAADVFDEEDGGNWQERILELTRVTKVVKGGKLMGFRCTAVVGNGQGLVGVGCQAGREIATAVKRALVDAKKSVVRVPLVGAGTIPHRVEAKFNAARCVILPAADGTGVLAGSSIRSVLELAGVQNVLAKRLGCRSLLNNARCAVTALEQLRTLQEVSKARGVPMERLLLRK